jgi:N-acetylglucosaminyldiphosphoundecaprenol N-acetyl-beta-D-mannosaminyltransferase
MQQRCPNLQIVGTFKPPFRALTPEEDRQLIEHIELCRPEIMWVGLGSPKQDRFMAEYLP